MFSTQKRCLIGLPKTTKFSPKLAFLSIAGSFGALLVGWLVDLARAVSRKTPIYFIYSFVAQFSRLWSRRRFSRGGSTTGRFQIEKKKTIMNNNRKVSNKKNLVKNSNGKLLKGHTQDQRVQLPEGDEERDNRFCPFGQGEPPF